MNEGPYLPKPDTIVEPPEPPRRASTTEGDDVDLGGLEPTEYPQFRPKRLTRADLEGISVEVSFALPDGIKTCCLTNISTTGLGFEPPPEVQLREGDPIRGLTVRGDTLELYRGEAVVRSVRCEPEGILIGASFKGAPMNIEHLVQLCQVRKLQRRAEYRVYAAEQPWHCAAPTAQAFEASVAQLHLYLRNAGERFADLERNLPWHALNGERVTPARRALVEHVRESFLPDYVRFTEQIDAARRQAPASLDGSMKAFSQALLHDTLMQAPFMERCLKKPLGYPGDYIVMLYLYERQFEGRSLLARAIHQATINTLGACAVRERKDMLLNAMRSLVEARASRGRLTRIISIAAGPAQETLEFLEHHPRLAKHVKVMLFDQDAEALEHVSNRLSKLAARAGTEAEVHLRHDTIKRLIKEPELFQEFGPADLIFSSGLFDYLHADTGERLIRNLYGSLAREGLLYVGNMVPENPCRWFLEHHLDWNLKYRSREELRAMGTAAAPTALSEIVEERTGVNPFLRLTRS